MKIIISGPAQAFDTKSEELVADPQRLAALHGLDYSTDKCANYLDGELDEIGIRGGVIRLAWENEQLRVVTEFESPRALSGEELAALVKDTRGQWSDGIGEGEFRHAKKHKLQIDLSPLSANEKDVIAQQIDDGKKVPAPRATPLHKAVDAGDEKLFHELLAKGVKLDTRDKYGNTPLNIACLAGRFEMALELIRRGANVNGTRKVGMTPLAHLCMCNDSSTKGDQAIAVLKMLLQGGAEVDAGDEEGITPLMWATNRGHMQLMSALIDAGANVNAHDEQKWNNSSVLMYAHTAEAIELLLSHGADPRAKNASGQTAWEYALLNNHVRGYRQRSELLRQHGEKLDQQESA